MKKSYKLLMLALAALAIVPALSSCLKDDDTGMKWTKDSVLGYFFIGTDTTNNDFWFVDDNGAKWYANLPKGFKYNVFDNEGNDKNGARMVVQYVPVSNEIHAGYDKTMNLQGIVEINNRNTGEINGPADEVRYGDQNLGISYAGFSPNGQWLDLRYEIQSRTSTAHMFSLVKNHTTDTTMCPSNYIYGELRHNSSLPDDGSAAYNTFQTYVSFKLPDYFNPVKQGKDGLFLRFRDEMGQIMYLRVVRNGGYSISYK